MDLYSGLNQDVPEDFYREKFALNEQPCVKIVKKKKPALPQ